MALEADFLELAASTSGNVVVTPLSTHNLYGAPVYGTAATFVGVVDLFSHLVVASGAQGSVGQREVASRGTVFVLSSSAKIGEQDLFQIDGITEDIIAVNHVNDDQGQHHVEVHIR